MATERSVASLAECPGKVVPNGFTIMTKVICVDESGRCNGPFFEQHFLESFNKKLLRKAGRSAQPKVTFDFADLTWADLLELLSIVGAMHYASTALSREVSFKVSEAAKSNDSVRHLIASGFFDLLRVFGIKANLPPPETTSPYSFFRFTNINNLGEKEYAGSLISKNVERYYPWLSDYQKLSFDRIVHEVLENSLEHAYGGLTSEVRPRMIAIRRFSKSFLEKNTAKKLGQQSYWLRDLLRTESGCDFLEICIVDIGVGIRASISEVLRDHVAGKLSREPLPAELDDLAALRFVLSPHKSTSSATEEGKGYGLYKFQDHVQAWGGLFLLRSGRARVIQSPASQSRDEKSNLAFFPGTQVRVLLPMKDRTMNVEYVLSKESELK